MKYLIHEKKKNLQKLNNPSQIKWLDWSGSLSHEIVFSETTRALKLSLENGESLELLYEVSVNSFLLKIFGHFWKYQG